MGTVDLGWVPPELQEYLQLISEGVATLMGFEIFVVNVVDGDQMIAVTLTGAEYSSRYDGEPLAKGELLGKRIPVAVIEEFLASGEPWGRRLVYAPAERMPQAAIRHAFYDPRYVEKSEPGAWRSDDALLAPIHDADGVLRGLVSIDRPHDGLLPGPEKRDLLEKYVDIVARAVISAVERHELEHRARLAAEARQMVRDAAGHRSLNGVLEEIADPLIESFGLHSIWTRVFLGQSPEFSRRREGGPAVLPRELDDAAHATAMSLWGRQKVGAIGRDYLIHLPEAEETERVRAYLEDVGAESLLAVPLGAGPDCFGVLVMVRPPGAGVWSTTEQEEALDIGRDLGRVLATARAFEEEARLGEELENVARLRSELVATVSHELRSPLTAALVAIDLAGEAEHDHTAAKALETAKSALRRMERIAEELQVAAMLDATGGRLKAYWVDLAALARDAQRLHRPLARDAEVVLDLDVPMEELRVWADLDQLDRAIANLVANGIKYTPAGGKVVIALQHEGQRARLSVIDDGIGIAYDEQDRIFEDFVRSSDPQARREEGTGLGLGLARRIVAAHHGSLSVVSAPGEGSTFTIDLPIRPPETP